MRAGSIPVKVTQGRHVAPRYTVCYTVVMSKWTKPENETLLAEAVRDNKSIAGVCRAVGLAPRGGSIATVKLQHLGT